MHRDKIEHFAAGFFRRFAPRDLGGRLAGVDDSGDDLGDPWRKIGGEGADAELFDQDDGVEVRIVEDDCDRVAALEDFTPNLGACSSGKQTVADPVAVDSEIALIGGVARDDLDSVGLHGKRS